MAEKRIVYFQSTKVKICRFFISCNYYIYLKSYFEIFVTNNFLVYSGGQLPLRAKKEFVGTKINV